MIDLGNDISLNNLNDVLEAYKAEFEAAYKKNLEADDRKATGNLINSISTTIRTNGTSINVILNVADYFRYVENGRGAGKFPPPDKILQWIQAKPVIPRPMANGKLPTEKQLAFLIGRKIAREGYEGKDSLKRTTEEVNEKYLPLLEDALLKDFDKFSIKVFQSIGKLVSYL